MKTRLRQAFHRCLCVVLIYSQVFPAHAQINVDSSAPASQRPRVTQAPNGVDLIDISAPNQQGLSHNKFSDYNVAPSGVILNNSAVVGTSRLGGAIPGNPNLKLGAEASTILNQVTSQRPSVLEGATEVFGVPAHVFVANPNGITCRGCAFINTPKATLTTGVPEIGANGALENLSIERGTITVDGEGLNAAGSKAELLSRAIEINGEIQAGTIKIVSGRNDYDPSTGVASPKADDGSTKPAFAIDSTALGGMYAGRIVLEGTEAGLGFRLSGDMAATAQDFFAENDGPIEIKNVAAERDIDVSTTSGHSVTGSGAMTSNGETRIDSSGDINFAPTATLESRGPNTSLTATERILSDEAAVVGFQALDLNATEIVNEGGVFLGKDDVTIQGSSPGLPLVALNNLGGLIESVSGDVIIDADSVRNVSDVETETVTTTFRFQWAGGSVPGSLPRGEDLSPEAYARFFRDNHVMAINPLIIESVLEDEGRSLDEFFNPSSGDYRFSVSDWQALAPSSTAEWNAVINAGLPQRERPWSVIVSGDGVRSGWYDVQLVEDQVKAGTNPKIAGISAQGGSLRLSAGAIVNDRGFLSAAEDVVIDGTTLDLFASDLSRRVVQRVNGGTTFSRETGWGEWLAHVSAITTFNDVVGSTPATIAAGGDLTGTLSGAVTAISEPVTELNDFDFGGTTHGVLRTVLEVGNRASPVFVNSGLVRPSSNARFKFETRFQFTDFGTFFGSDYFIAGVLGPNYDHDEIPRRLGDDYIDSRLIVAQILATGRRFTDGSFSADSQQIKALLDAGIVAWTDLNLTPFLALTPAQQDALTTDIVWYEEQEFQGEKLLVPRLYLSRAVLDSDWRTRRAISLVAAANSRISAAEISTVGASINAGLENLFATTGSVTARSSAFSGRTFVADVGGSFFLDRDDEEFGNGLSHVGTLLGLESVVQAEEDIRVSVGDMFAAIGTLVEAGEDIFVDAEHVLIAAQVAEGRSDVTGPDGKEHKGYLRTVTSSRFTAGGSIDIHANNSVVVRASRAAAQNYISISSLLGDVVIEAEESIRSGSMRNSDKSSGDNLKISHVVSLLSTQSGNITIASAKGNVSLEAPIIESGDEIEIIAREGRIEIRVVKDQESAQYQGSKTNPVWQKFVSRGFEREKIRHAVLTGKGPITFSAADGVEVEYRSKGNLRDDIQQLSRAPGLAWMAQFVDDPLVDFRAVSEVHRQWSVEQEGLGPAAAAIVAIAVAAATSGAGASILGLTSGGTATAGTTAFSIGASNAAFTALVQQATISAINNKGNLGKVFGELTSSAAVRSIAASALTAGLTKQFGGDLLSLGQPDGRIAFDVVQSLEEQFKTAVVSTGVDVVVTGADLSDSLRSNFRLAGAAVLGAQLSQSIGIEFEKNKLDASIGFGRGEQLLAHAILGCGVGLVGTGNCGAGAAGQLAGEIAGLMYSEVTPRKVQEQTDEWRRRGINVARVAGALAAAAAGGSAEDVRLGANAGGTAAENNVFCGGLCIAAAVVGAGLITGYAAHQGEGDVRTGFRVIGRKEDPVNQALAAVVTSAHEVTGKALVATLPEEAIIGTAGFIVYLDEKAADVVTIVDEATGKRVSTAINSIPIEDREVVLGVLISQSYLAGAYGTVGKAVPNSPRGRRSFDSEDSLDLDGTGGSSGPAQAIQRLDEATFQAALSGSPEVITGFRVLGSKGLVGETFNRNIFLLESDGGQSIRALLKSFELEARGAGAQRLSIVGSTVINPKLLNARAANRLGYSFRHLDDGSILLEREL